MQMNSVCKLHIYTNDCTFIFIESKTYMKEEGVPLNTDIYWHCFDLFIYRHPLVFTLSSVLMANVALNPLHTVFITLIFTQAEVMSFFFLFNCPSTLGFTTTGCFQLQSALMWYDCSINFTLVALLSPVTVNLPDNSMGLQKDAESRY